MTLAEAQKIAEATRAFLEPVCERIEIAGSIRRRRPECADVDLVVIPRISEQKDFFGVVTGRENLVRKLLIEYARDTRPKPQWVTGKEPEPNAQNLLLKGPKAQLDVWIATPATWATRLITRTGSMQHNVWIANRAIARRGKFRPYEGLWFSSMGLIQPSNEEQFYEALGLPFIPPEKREPMALARLEMELAR